MMTSVAADALAEIVAQAVAETRVPGLVAGILHGGERSAAAAGHANLPEGVEMTPDTLFLLGSVTKVLTATALMTLVDDGRAGLDDPVRRHLPELRLADRAATEAVTLRMLLEHSSGIDAADHAEDFGSNPDSMLLYVRSLARFGQLYEPGSHFSYCNPGYVIAGRVLEQLTGAPYDEAMRERLCAPLGLARTVFGASSAILHRVCAGHFPDGRGGWRRTDTWMLPHCLGPAGATLATTVDDMLTFAQLHLAAGRTVEGTQLLGDAALAAMHQGRLGPPVPAAVTQAAGWSRVELAHGYALRHTGGSMGGMSSLLAVPGEDFAFIAFANCAGAEPVLSRVEERIVDAVFGDRAEALHAREQPAAPVDGRADLERHAGVYRRHGFRHLLRVLDGALVMTVDIEDAALAGYFGGVTHFELPLTPCAGGGFAMPGSAAPTVAFVADEQGEFLYWGLRMARRE